MPSMLRWYPPQEITKLITSASLPSLFVKFKSDQVPSNLFPRLVVQLLQWGRNEFWSRVDPQLYKSFARIYTAEDKNYSVVLLCHSSMIEVVVHKGNARSPKDDLQTDLGNLDLEINAIHLKWSVLVKFSDSSCCCLSACEKSFVG